MKKQPKILQEPPSDYGGDAIPIQRSRRRHQARYPAGAGDIMAFPETDISLLFHTERSVIAKHLQNIFKTQELKKDSVCAFFAQTAADGKTYQVEHYNLDAILYFLVKNHPFVDGNKRIAAALFLCSWRRTASFTTPTVPGTLPTTPWSPSR
jgi:hypothetical protein